MREVWLTKPMRMLANMLESRTGQILSENRLWRLETSLKPVLRANGLATMENLVAEIITQPEGRLATQAVNALINNETSFFRDAHIFHMLARDLLPAMIEQAEARNKQRLLRVWCAGCSTGQEAYSLAMTFQKGRDAWRGWRMQILATDVSTAVVERARSGLFSQMDVQRGLAIDDLIRWMEPAADQWQISPVLRDMIDFRVDNLFNPSAPAGEYDIIFCRNVLLYFSPERKRRIFDLLARHSAPGGLLLLGAGEATIGHTTDFAASARYRGIYERLDPRYPLSPI